MVSQPKNVTQTTKTEPWYGAMPGLLDTYARTNALMQEGTPNYYPGQTVIDLSQATKDAQGWQEKMAREVTPGAASAQNMVRSATDGSLFSSKPLATMNNLQDGIRFGANPATAGVSAFADGAYRGTSPGQSTLSASMGYSNPALGVTAAMLPGLSQDNRAINMLEQTANGSMLNNNPYLSTAISSANRQLMDDFKTNMSPALDAAAARAGRTGSGAQASVRNNSESALFDRMSKNTNDIMMQNYQTERGNQLNAQNQIGALVNSDRSNMLAGSSLFGSQSAQQQGLRMDAANSANSQHNSELAQMLSALGMRSDMYQNDVNNQFRNADLMMNAANSAVANENSRINTQLNAAGMAGAMDNLRYAGADRLAQVGQQRDLYNDLVLQGDIAKWDQNQNKQWDNVGRAMGIYTGGGYNTATTNKPVFNNTLGSVLGAGASIASLFACDRRIKENIRRIGTMDNGLPLYVFTYKADASKKLVIGPMAQDVEEVAPDAVVEFEGIKLVNMDALIGDSSDV